MCRLGFALCEVTDGMHAFEGERAEVWAGKGGVQPELVLDYGFFSKPERRQQHSQQG